MQSIQDSCQTKPSNQRFCQIKTHLAVLCALWLFSTWRKCDAVNRSWQIKKSKRPSNFSRYCNEMTSCSIQAVTLFCNSHPICPRLVSSAPSAISCKYGIRHKSKAGTGLSNHGFFFYSTRSWGKLHILLWLDTQGSRWVGFEVRPFTKRLPLTNWQSKESRVVWIFLRWQFIRSLMCLCRSNSLKSRPNNLSWNLPCLRSWLYGKMGTSPNLAWLEAPTGGKWGPSTSTRPRFGSGGKSLGQNSVLRLLKASRRSQWFVEVWSCGCALPKYARGRDGTSFACVAT